MYATSSGLSCCVVPFVVDALIPLPAISADYGATWSAGTVLLSFEARGQIGKMTANRLLVTQNGTWLLPFWQEAYDRMRHLL